MVNSDLIVQRNLFLSHTQGVEEKNAFLYFLEKRPKKFDC